MFNLLQSANDDQTAIVACAVTIIGAAALVFASFHLGPAGQRLKNRQRAHSAIGYPNAPELDRGVSQERAA